MNCVRKNGANISLRGHARGAAHLEPTSADISLRGHKLGRPAPWDAASAKRDTPLSVPSKDGIRASRRHGFTLVELALAISFISVLLLMLSFLIIQMTTTYQKTLTLRSVNSAGRELIDEFSHTISASTLVSTTSRCATVDDGFRAACVTDNAFRFIYHQYESQNFKVAGKDLTEPVPTSGVFCTGLYSYIWNSGYVLNDKNQGASTYRAKIRYTIGSDIKEKNDFKLYRIFDVGGRICASDFNGSTYTLNSDPAAVSYDLGVIAEEPKEMLESSEAELAIYDLRIFHPARHVYSGQAYYSGTFILATLQGEVDINANGEYCTAPMDSALSEFTYCAVNKFNFASQATGETE